MRKLLAAPFCLFWLFLPHFAHADGFIILHPPRPEMRILPLSVKTPHVKVKIQDLTAHTEVDQVFYNPNASQLEGTYLFPLPESAAVSTMSLWINGREEKAELLPRAEAVKIYTDIVRSMKDPALLEYMGNRLFRVRIFPIEPRSEKRIKIAYTEALEIDSGLLSYRYPLATEKFSLTPLEEVSIEVEVQSALPLKSLFSPSHTVQVTHLGPHGAWVRFEQKQVLPRKDFFLYAALSREAEKIGAALAASREPGEDGFFALYLAPGEKALKARPMPKDVVFVFDTSGSMKEPADKPWKIDQARAALSFCVNSLNEGDRFNIVSFATTARAFRDRLQPVDEHTRSAAHRFLESMDARGGTNVDDALQTALAQQEDLNQDRPFFIVFLTDGQPTLGERQNPDELTALVREKAKKSTRLFVFGVGYDVNTHLLDRLARDNRGERVYVAADENIELKVSGFFDKISFPVLTDVQVKVEGVSLYDLSPTMLPDLFHGSRLTLYGRYSGSGEARVQLTGRVSGTAYSQNFPLSFPAVAPDHPHIPRLWASTRIGYLLEQLRLKNIDVASGQPATGPEKELVDEIVSLASAYGIVTPYTALLVVEDVKHLGRAPLPAARRLMEVRKKAGVSPVLDSAGNGFSRSSGKSAFEASRRAKALQQGLGGTAMENESAIDQALDSARTIKEVDNKTFLLIQGVWYDSLYVEGTVTRKIPFLSEAYFKLILDNPRLARYLSVGNRVVVSLGNEVVEITE